ncbi:hypothetical protein IV203_021068 [Nitzschia inconspicua]|uniref:Uncharacterized protein n=1 Tax=Nitzschia inconspicua TaxID=303405 RepID=A0A9K3PD43_9STRA|nr:hypothetical protein IV203_021068 [Nitzschia inconspicua]
MSSNREVRRRPAKGEREFSEQVFTQSRKRGMQQDDRNKTDSGRRVDEKKPKMLHAPVDCSSPSISRNQPSRVSGYKKGGVDSKNDGNKQSSSIDEKDSRCTSSEHGATSLNSQVGALGQGDEGGEGESSLEDKTSLLYTENIMAAAAATNDELEAAGVAALVASPTSIRDQACKDASSLLQHQPTRKSIANSARLENNATSPGLLHQVILLENSQLRRVNEQLLLEVQASRNVISRLLAHCDPAVVGNLLQGERDEALSFLTNLIHNPISNLSRMPNAGVEWAGGSASTLGSVQSHSMQRKVGQAYSPSTQHSGLNNSQLHAGSLLLSHLSAISPQQIQTQQQRQTQLSTLNLLAAAQQQTSIQRMFQPLIPTSSQLHEQTEQMRLAQTQSQQRQLRSRATSNASDSERTAKSGQSKK